MLVSDQEGSSVRVLMFLDWWVVKPCHHLTQPIVRMTSNVNHHLALIALCILIILLIFFLVIIKFAWIVVVFFSGPDRFLRGWNVRQVSRFEELQLFVVWSWVLFVFVFLIKFLEPLFAVLEGVIRLIHMIGFRKYLLTWFFYYIGHKMICCIKKEINVKKLL